MFKKILLPVDLSDRHQEALRVAADLARQGSGEVVLLHVIEVIPGLPAEEDFYRRLERIAGKHLDSLKSVLAAEKIPVRSEILVGNRGGEIIRVAREMNADLVVLTVPTVDPENVSAGLGSLGYKVSIFAPCPVLLVK